MKFKNIIIRPIERNDLEFLRLMHNDTSVINYLTDTHMVNEIEQEKWFEKICLSPSSKRLAVIDYQINKIVGCIRIDNIDYINRSVQVGGDIHPEFQGMGFGNMMFGACLCYIFDTMAMRRAYLSVLETNMRAYNMYAKFGFTEEGRQHSAIFRDGQYLDYINMYLLESGYRSLPLELKTK